MGKQRRADLGRERSGVDDAARALRDEMPRRDLVGEEYPARIDGEIEVPFLVGQFKRVLHGGDAGVGDANLAPAKLRERLAERALDRGALAHIDVDGDRTRASLLRGSPGCLVIDIGDRDFHSASRERGGDGAANAVSAAGYKGAPAAELRIRRTAGHCPSSLQRVSHINKIEASGSAFCLIMSISGLGCRHSPSRPAQSIKRLPRMRIPHGLRLPRRQDESRDRHGPYRRSPRRAAL